jgi:hypothetical protein
MHYIVTGNNGKGSVEWKRARYCLLGKEMHGWTSMMPSLPRLPSFFFNDILELPETIMHRNTIFPEK